MTDLPAERCGELRLRLESIPEVAWSWGLQNIIAEMIDLGQRSLLRPVEDRHLIGSSSVSRILVELDVPVSEHDSLVEAYRIIEDLWAELVGWGARPFPRRVVEQITAHGRAVLADAPLMSSWRQALLISAGATVGGTRGRGNGRLSAYTDAVRWRERSGAGSPAFVQVGWLVALLRSGSLESVTIDPGEGAVALERGPALLAPEKTSVSGELEIRASESELGVVMGRSGGVDRPIVVQSPSVRADVASSALFVAANSAVAKVTRRAATGGHRSP